MSEEAKYRLMEDVCLQEFYEKRNNTSLCLTKLQAISMERYFPGCPTYEPIASFSLYFGEYFPEEFPIISNILLLANGKLSLCGGNLFNILLSDLPHRLNLYFHSCELFEANKIMEEVLILPECKYVFRDSEELAVTIEGYDVRFHLPIYKDEEGVLTSIKHGWNPISGYYCTIIFSLLSTLQLDPIMYPMKMEDYWNKKYKPNVVGIPYKNYITFAKSIFNTQPDIFRLLCFLWFEVIVYDAKKRLIWQV